ncbi:hypothetical protein M1589_02365 [Candidatus Marsarchaeota archaeon]|nr:hypothetical protein [Candidatus Marsarchaeota archaeon]
MEEKRMPLKHNVTKYDVLATKIHHLSQKQNSDLTKDEKRAEIMAVLVASLTSSQSWKTHQHLMDGLANLNSDDVKEEYRQALTTRWKNVTAADINEVLSKGISAQAFSTWLFFTVEPQNQSLYKSVWDEMCKEFTQACDDIEVTASSKR